MSTLSENISIPNALFNKTKQVLLGLLFSNIDNTYHLRGIAKRLNISPGSIQRELKVLTAAGIVQREQRGNQVFFQANRNCPIFRELHSLVIKTTGLADKLRETLTPLANRIDTAFIYGSFARGSETTGSDIDLMFIGDLKLHDVIKTLGKVRDTIGRELNPSVFSRSEYRNKLERANHFLTSLKDEPKIFLIGSEDELRTLG